MFKDSYQEFRKFVESNEIQFVDIKYVDLPGRLHNVTLPIDNVDEELFEEGIGFDSSSVTGFKSAEKGDMNLVPDLSTGFIEPFWDAPTLSFLSFIKEAHSKNFAPRCPRGMAVRTKNYLQTKDLGKSLWLPELEFNLFNQVSIEAKPHRAHSYFQSDEAENRGCSISHEDGYHQTPPGDLNFNLRSKIVNRLEDADIPVKYHHHEVGKRAQCEIEIKPSPLLKACDSIIIGKYIIRMTAKEHGLSACFLPKPIPNEAGNGLHVHQLLKKEGTSLFSGNQYANLSELALNYIGGLLQKGRSLAALTNPSTNSFKRLIPGYEAPTKLFFDIANRSAAIRIPKYCGKDTRRIEYRPPDATMNPYIALPAMLMAGLEGIDKQIDPSQNDMGPFDTNVFAQSEEKYPNLGSFPDSLSSSLDNFKEDHSFLIKKGLFSKKFITTWVKIKRNEIKKIDRYPNPKELKLYYNF